MGEETKLEKLARVSGKATSKGLDALAVEGWEFPKPPTCVVGESDPDHENFRYLKQGPGALIRSPKVGRMVGR